ncbi:MAG: hypothetical protein RLO50_07760 [Azospirillaceae bacterium]
MTRPSALGGGGGASDLTGRQRVWRSSFAERLYGVVPPPPDRLLVSRERLPGEAAERLVLDLAVAERRHRVDAALWLPPDRRRPVPLIVALDFLGPVGILPGDGFPLDPDAVIGIPPQPWLPEGRLSAAARGRHQARWPVAEILGRGFGLLVSGYGSWVPDDPVRWRDRGVAALFPHLRTGALSLWAWALSRLIDLAQELSEVDPSRLVLFGHSRLGKAALWAAAGDARPAAVIANNSGAAGAALSRRNFGETLAHLRDGFPHWTVLDAADAAEPARLPVDQHQLLAAIAPRALYIASAAADLWADPRGEYLALLAAAPAWGGVAAGLPTAETAFVPGNAVAAGPLGWHLRDGPHDQTEWDWARFLDFLADR